MWGQLNGAMDSTTETFKGKNIGRKNEKSPEDVAKKTFEDRIKAKVEDGYREVDLKTNKPLSKKAASVLDFNEPHKNSTHFKAFKPQNSMNAYMTKKVEDLTALFSRKRDGYMHYLIVDDKGRPRLYSSNMAWSHTMEEDIPWLDRYAGITHDLTKLNLPPRTMLLGEVCTSAMSHRTDLGHAVDDFQYVGSIIKSLTPRAIELQREKGELAFCVWDVMFYDGDPWVQNLPAIVRFDNLGRLLRSAETRWITKPELVTLQAEGFLVKSHEGLEIDAVYDDEPLIDIVNWAKEQGWEGYVVIDPQSTYGDRAWSFHGKNERPKEVCKLKPDIDVDVIVRWDPKNKVGEMGKGKHSGQVGSVAAYLFDDTTKQEVFVGKVGTGITDEQAKKFAKVNAYPMVWQITAKGWTDGGKLRHASLERVREDKKLEECGIEQRPGGA
jgi:ATP-dependent DNA ligase